MRCPYCGSKMLYPDKTHKTFSGGKALAGGLAFGVVGAAAGFIGKDTKGYRCSACGAFSEKSMDINTEFSINSAVSNAKNGINISFYEQLKEQYPNIEAVYTSQQNNTHTQTASNETYFEKSDSEKDYDTANEYYIKNTYHPNIFIPNCPIYVEEIIIKTSDSGDKLSLKAWNNSNKTLRSAYFNVKVFDDVGDEISNCSCVYQGMMVESGMQLPAEKEFHLNTDIAYTIQYDIEKAAFDDGSVWRKDDQNESFKLSEQSELSPHSFPKYKHLKSLFLEKSNSEYDGSLFEPIFEETHTQCICGFPREREAVCTRCGLNDEAISEIISYDNILKRQRDTIMATAKKRAKETQKLYDSGCKEIYKKAINLQSKETKKDVQESIKLFNKILDYKDSAEQIEKCNQNIKAINEKLEAKRIADTKAAEEKRAKEEAERKEKERLAEIERAEAEKRAKRNKKIAIITTPIVCAIIAFIIVLNTVIIPNQKKNKFIATYGQDVFDKFGVVEKGKYITFGEYEQDNTFSNGKEPLEWLVLEVSEQKALVISKYVIDQQKYNSKKETNWKDCSLRSWLNNEFINNTFSNTDKTSILLTTYENNIQDNIFLLSKQEAEKYFDSASDRICKPTNYLSAYLSANNYGSKNCGWSLRSMETKEENHRISHEGNIYSYYTNEDSFIRPAMWIDLSQVQ